MNRVDNRLDILPTAVVQNIGLDSDCDEVLQQQVIETAKSVVPEDYEDVVDTILLWWRDEDGDLIDALLDCTTMLDEKGDIWLLTPKPGRPGEVNAADIAEAAPTSGLKMTANISAADDWQAARFVARS